MVPFDADHSPSRAIETQARINVDRVSCHDSSQLFALHSIRLSNLQSTEHIPPISPIVLLYPTMKLRKCLYRSAAK